MKYQLIRSIIGSCHYLKIAAALLAAGNGPGAPAPASGGIQALAPFAGDPFFLKRHLLVPYEAGEHTVRLLSFDGEARDASRHRAATRGTGLAWTGGVMGQAARFDGTATVELDAPADLSAGFMVEAWVWLERPPDEEGRSYSLLSWPGAFDAGFEVHGLDRLRPKMDVVTDQGVFQGRTTMDFPLRRWFHVSFTYDPDRQPGPPPPAADGLHASIRETAEPLPVTIRVQGIELGGLDAGTVEREGGIVDSRHRDRAGFKPRGRLRTGTAPLRIGDGFYGKIDELRISALPPDSPPVHPWLSGRWGDFSPFRPDAVHPGIEDHPDLGPWAGATETGAFRLLAVEAVPTFESIGLYVRYAGTASGGVAVRYRALSGGTWKDGLDLVADPHTTEYRGSLLQLQPATEYEIEIRSTHSGDADRHGSTLRFQSRTWEEAMPVGRDVVLPAGVLTEPLVIDGERGAPEGWIRYRPPEGESTILDVRAGGHAHAVRMDRSAYVILEGLTIRGGERHAVYVTDSHDVRIRRNDISAWSIAGAEDPGRRVGLYVHPVTGGSLNQNDAVRLGPLTRRIVVEDNYMHRPRGTATCWRWGHPVGPQAMTFYGIREVVVRHNDAVGSEEHWFNDIFGTTGHSAVYGGVYRDVDIYGNFLAYAQDNHVELDGGVLHARLWNNRMLYGYREIALAPTIKGPSYVFHNLVDYQGDEFLRTGSSYKLGWPGRNFGRNILLHNTVVEGGGVDNRPELYVTGGREVLARNNLGGRVGQFFDPRDPWRREPRAGEIVFVDRDGGDYRLQAVSQGAGEADLIPGFPTARRDRAPDLGIFPGGATEDPQWPPRPSGMRIDPLNLAFEMTAGVRSGAGKTVVLDVPVSAGERWRAHPNASWIHVEPEYGATGEPVTVQVSVDARDLEARGHRGVVTFRTDQGLNRSLSLQARVRHAEPFIQSFDFAAHSAADGAVERVPDEDASQGIFTRVLKPGTEFELSFDAPQPGSYYILARLRSPPGTSGNFRWSLNRDAAGRWFNDSREAVTWIWMVLDPHADKQTRVRDRGFVLDAGRHVFRLLNAPVGVEIDCLLVSNEPYPPALHSRIRRFGLLHD